VKANLNIKSLTPKNYSLQNISKKNKNKKLIREELKKIINNKHNFFKEQYHFSFKKNELKKYTKFKTIVVIGMGGSILGAKAIYTLMKHKIKKKVLFFDNLSENNIRIFNKKKNNKNNLFIIISKSGNTIETLCNVNFLKKAKFCKKNTIIITEKKSSALARFAKNMKILTIEHKKNIGGRFSILTEVGMVPALLMGLNIDKFKLDFTKHLKTNEKMIQKNILETSEIYLSKKINSLILLNYNSKLKNISYWLQQLLAESLGKNGKGLLPIVSSAPKDHHSLLQLYLDGPRDKIFYILDIKNIYKINSKNNYFKKELPFLSNKSLEKIVNSQKNAFTKTLKDKKIPYRIINLNTCTEQTLGYFFSYFMLETIILGKIMGVNPYDQDAVEKVKILTKKNLT